MRNIIKRIIIDLMAIFLSLSLTSPARAYIAARVVDAKTGEPVQGAKVVFMKVYMENFPIADFGEWDYCPILSWETSTTREGKFSFLITDYYAWPLCELPEGYWVVIYKPGYYVNKGPEEEDEIPADFPTRDLPEMKLKPHDGSYDPCEEWIRVKSLTNLKGHNKNVEYTFENLFKDIEEASRTDSCAQGMRLVELARTITLVKEHSERKEQLSEIIRILDHYPQVVSYQNRYTGRTALHYAVERGDLPLTQLLLARGADVNKRSIGSADPGELPLHHVHDYEIAKMLIEHGSLINVWDSKGWAPLHEAALQSNVDVMKLLLEHGADTNIEIIVEKFGKFSNPDYRACPIHIVSSTNTRGGIALLISHGANINARNARGETPLHYAIKYAQKQNVFDLIAMGADINAKTIDGVTPLGYAYWINMTEVIDFLLSRGAVIE